jgi:hypothetical protein
MSSRLVRFLAVGSTVYNSLKGAVAQQRQTVRVLYKITKNCNSYSLPELVEVFFEFHYHKSKNHCNRIYHR